MLITVIVPIYNMEAYMRCSIDSLRRQTFQDFEILLIDDGSKDSSPQICDQYVAEDPRIRVIHKPNGGLSSARNVGIENARGKYLTFCDPDDWVDPDYLQQFIDAGMDEQTLPVTGIVQHRDSHPDRYFTAPALDLRNEACVEAIIALRRCDGLGFTVNKLFVKRIIEENHLRFIEGLAHREDELFMMEYVRYISRIVINQKTPYHYRVLGNSLSKKRKPTELILRVANQLHELFALAAPTAEGRYLGARIYLQQTCEAVAVSKNGEELQQAIQAARNSRKNYLQAFDPAYLKDRRDRKVAQRSRWIFTLGSLSAHLQRRLTRLIHI